MSKYLHQKASIEQVFEQILYESSQLTTLDGITPTEPESTQMMKFGTSLEVSHWLHRRMVKHF